MTSTDDFEKAIDAHYDRVYRLARVMSGNDDDARDLTQETFLEAFKGLRSFQGRSAMGTWLIGILRRRFLLSLRRRPTEPLAEDIIAPSSYEPHGNDANAAVLPAIATLEEPMRTTLFLFYFERMDYAAIAEALDCPIGTVRSRLHQGRDKLRRALTPLMQESAR